MKLNKLWFIVLIIFVTMSLVGLIVSVTGSEEVKNVDNCLEEIEKDYNGCLTSIIKDFESCGGENSDACIAKVQNDLQECIAITQENSKQCIDSDNDNIPEFEDACQNSNLGASVIIDECDSKVANHLLNNGCTINDLIDRCASNSNNHGNFISCVAGVTNDLQKDGIITGREKGSIQRCTARANIP